MPKNISKPSRLRKWQAKWRRYQKRWFLMAPAVTHPLFDAPMPIAEKTRKPVEVNERFLQRIVDNYRCNDKAMGNISKSLWDDIGQRQQGYIRALSAGDTDKLVEYFQNMFVNQIAEGMAHAEGFYFGDDAWKPGFTQLRMTDILLSLGEALCILPLPTYSQMKLMTYVDYLHTDQDQLFKAIEDQLGFSLAMPLVGNPPVFTFNGTKTSLDLVRHAYLPHKIRQLNIPETGKIIEIGGGIGSVALLANRAGYKDYTIIDLPFVGAMQMFFLGSALGEAKVAGSEEAPSEINLYGSQKLADMPDQSVDLVINIDSMPEMGRETALNYLRDIKRVAKRFLSINQESQAYHDGVGNQLLIPALIEEVGGFKRVQRSRYWMGEGYAEEVYEVVG